MIDICMMHASAGERQMRNGVALLVDVNGHMADADGHMGDAGRHIGHGMARVTLGTMDAYINASRNHAAIGDRHMNTYQLTLDDESITYITARSARQARTIWTRAHNRAIVAIKRVSEVTA